MTSPSYRSLDVPGECTALAQLVTQTFANPSAYATSWLESAGWTQCRVLATAELGLIAALVRVPMAHYLGGAAVPTLGITGVAVRLDQRRAGHGALLMQQALHEARADGYACSSLFASHHGFYRHLGFEHAALRTRVDVSIHRLRARERSGSIVCGRSDELGVIEALYDVVAREQPFFVARTPYFWRRILQERGNLAPVVLMSQDEGQKPDGYAVVRIARIGDSFAQNVTIEDWAAHTPAAIARLWGALASMDSLATAATFYSAPSDPFFLGSGDPAPRLGTAEPLMLRILDVQKALSTRGYRMTSDCSLRFAVRDPLFATNEGPWHLRVQRGQVEIEPCREAACSLDIGALAGLYSGHLDLSALMIMGRACGDTVALQDLADLLAGPRPWLRELY